MEDGGFTFPKLPKPTPLANGPVRPLPPTNPLLAGATVVDRSTTATAAAAGQGSGNPAAAEAGRPATAGQEAVTAAAASGGLEAGADGSMGGSLGKPVVLSRHQRIAPAAAAARRKVPFEKGYSQMDWVRLTHTHPDLNGLGGQRPRRGITMEEVAKHCTAEDAWTVLRGKVYNITHYLRFHPGGVSILLKVAGKDATALFNKYHAWVNDEFLLAKCLVGLLAPPSSSAGGSSASKADTVAATASNLNAAAESRQAAAAAAGAGAATQGEGGSPIAALQGT